MPNISGKLPTLQSNAAQRSSVQDFDILGAPRLTILQIASVADEAPSWPSLLRDQYLDRFWSQEPFLAGAIFSVASRNASFRWEVTGSRRQAAWAQQLLSQSDFGRGWQSLMMKLTVDLLTQSNGAFLEIIRPTRAKLFSSKSMYDAVRIPHPETNSPIWVPYDRHSGKFLYSLQHGKDFSISDSPLDLPVGLAHLDSQKCTRTNDPSRPAYYTDDKGRRHLLSSHQCVPLSEMPSPRKHHLGYQWCAVDRALRLSQIIRDMLIYKHEKVSGRFARAIHLTNIDAEAIQDAVDQAEQAADNKGLIRYSQPIVAATLDPNARPGIETIELASLPDGFSEDTSLRWYVAGLALDLGVDYGFLAPLPGNRLGTGTQAETAERQAKGKSSRLFINFMEHTINWSGILPRCTAFRFNTPDPYEESERDRALGRRARSLSILIKAGVITPEVAAQIAADSGDLDPQYLAQMGLADLTPITTMSGNDVTCNVPIRRFAPKPPRQEESPKLGEPSPDGGDEEKQLAVSTEPHITVHVTESPPPQIDVHVSVPEREIKMEAPITVNVPERTTPITVNVPERGVNVAAPQVNVTPPQVDVRIDAPNVELTPNLTLHQPDQVMETETIVERSPVSGNIIRTVRRSRNVND